MPMDYRDNFTRSVMTEYDEALRAIRVLKVFSVTFTHNSFFRGGVVDETEGSKFW